MPMDPKDPFLQFLNDDEEADAPPRALENFNEPTLRQLWRAERITEDQWRQELIARGDTEQSARVKIATQKNVGISTAASTRGQLTGSEAAGVAAIQATVPSAISTTPPAPVVASTPGANFSPNRAMAAYQGIPAAGAPGATAGTPGMPSVLDFLTDPGGAMRQVTEQITGRPQTSPGPSPRGSGGGGSSQAAAAPAEPPLPLPVQKLQGYTAKQLLDAVNLGFVSQEEALQHMESQGVDPVEARNALLQHVDPSLSLGQFSQFARAKYDPNYGFDSAAAPEGFENVNRMGVPQPNEARAEGGVQEGFTYGSGGPHGAFIPSDTGSSQHFTQRHTQDILRQRGIRSTGNLEDDLALIGMDRNRQQEYIDQGYSPGAAMAVVREIDEVERRWGDERPGIGEAGTFTTSGGYRQRNYRDPVTGIMKSISGYAQGGRHLLAEPTVGIGMYSGTPQFLAAEAGKQEYADIRPDGSIRFTPTDRDVSMGRERGGSARPMFTDVPRFATGGTFHSGNPLSGGGSSGRLTTRQRLNQGYDEAYRNLDNLYLTNPVAQSPTAFERSRARGLVSQQLADILPNLPPGTRTAGIRIPTTSMGQIIFDQHGMRIGGPRRASPPRPQSLADLLAGLFGDLGGGGRGVGGEVADYVEAGRAQQLRNVQNRRRALAGMAPVDEFNLPPGQAATPVTQPNVAYGIQNPLQTWQWNEGIRSQLQAARNRRRAQAEMGGGGGSNPALASILARLFSGEMIGAGV